MSSPTTTTTDPDKDDAKNNDNDKSNDKSNDQDNETSDEWSVLAGTYTASLVPAFQPIYNAIAEDVIVAAAVRQQPWLPSCYRVLDFGCGPGEPCHTLARELTKLASNATTSASAATSKRAPTTTSPTTKIVVVGVDSTPAMLALARERLGRGDTSIHKNDAVSVSLHHVRRDVTVEDLEKMVAHAVSSSWSSQSSSSSPHTVVDAVVSAFVVHYVPFARRVELTTGFLRMAPSVLYVTWGKPSRVGFLRALKTFATWKAAHTTTGRGTSGTVTDICSVQLDDPDDHSASGQTPTGSFTMARKETFQGIVDEIVQQQQQQQQGVGAKIASFETKHIPITFPTVATLLNFLPMPTNEDDGQAMLQLLTHWNTKHAITTADDNNDNDNTAVTFLGGDDVPLKERALCFTTDVVFCRISREHQPAE